MYSVLYIDIFVYQGTFTFPFKDAEFDLLKKFVCVCVCVICVVSA